MFRFYVFFGFIFFADAIVIKHFFPVTVYNYGFFFLLRYYSNVGLGCNARTHARTHARRYFRRLLNVRQMDFNEAIQQMVWLVIRPVTTPPNHFVFR